MAIRFPWLGALALFAAGANSCEQPTSEISGTLEARRVTISAEIQARIVKLHVREGARVAVGDALLDLDSSLETAEVARAGAQRAAAAAQLAELEAGSRKEDLDRAAAALESARARLELARLGARDEVLAQLEAQRDGIDARLRLGELTLGRAKTLLQSGPGTQAEVDAAAAELDGLHADRKRVEAELAAGRLGARTEELGALEGAVAEADAQLALLRAGPRREVIDAARAALDSARAAEQLAQARLARASIRAPVAGAIEVLDYEEGELAPLGAPLLAIASAGPLRVRSYAPQRVLGDLKVNDRVPVIVDGFPTQPLSARVERIWDQPEFTAGNVQTSDDRMLLVFRVDLELEPSDDPPLRPGTSVVVRFDQREH